MGIESYFLTYKPERTDDMPSVIKMIESEYAAVSKLSDEMKYMVRAPDYVIDFLQLGSAISVRIALCCSEAAIDKVFDVFKSVSANTDGSLYDPRLNIRTIVFSIEEREQVKARYMERQEFFFDHVAYLQDVAISSDEVYDYIRSHGILSRLSQNKP
jgi:hypothetical protein